MYADNSDSKMNTVVFLHMPKAGGQSLVNLLKKNFKKRTEVYDRPFRTLQLDEMILDMEKYFKNKEIILGHFGYGIEHYISSEVRYITYMREPIKRVHSLYYFILATPWHYLYKEVIKMSLCEFMESKITYETDNCMIRYVLGEKGKILSFAECSCITEEHYIKALEILEKKFSFVGILEDFDDSLLLLRNVIGISDMKYLRMNDNSLSKQKLTKDEHDIIERCNAFDIKLYNYFRDRYYIMKESSGVSKEEFDLAKEKLINYQKRNRAKTYLISKMKYIYRAIRKLLY